MPPASMRRTQPIRRQLSLCSTKRRFRGSTALKRSGPDRDGTFRRQKDFGRRRRERATPANTSSRHLQSRADLDRLRMTTNQMIPFCSSDQGGNRIENVYLCASRFRRGQTVDLRQHRLQRMPQGSFCCRALLHCRDASRRHHPSMSLPSARSRTCRQTSASPTQANISAATVTTNDAATCSTPASAFLLRARAFAAR